MTRINDTWQSTGNLLSKNYTCGYCGKEVASIKGYHAGDKTLYLCPGCNRPTLFVGSEQTPGELPGKSIDNLPDGILKLYQEAQRCISASSYTACVLLCRKILMHVGHDKGAEEGLNFVAYIEYLLNNHFITPDGKGWVDYIRLRGNEANHEIKVFEKEDAMALLALAEMLLLNIYDLPNRVPKPPVKK
jgi:DNA-directed RNA polymerase subunit RPC12/RpoP